jgi:hypothetical protein
MWVSAIAFMMVLSAAVCASAREFPPPSWIGNDGTTFQQWSFMVQDSDPQPPDILPHWINEFGGTPLLSVYGGEWSDNVDGHQGSWKFMGFGSGMVVDIPNNPKSQPVKEIWVELTWKAAGLSNFIPDQPIVNVWADHFEVEHILPDVQMDNNWMASLYKINIWPNPSSEQITINGDIRLDQVIVDTYCVPEPATVGLLICGALLAFRRRRKS